MNSLLLPSHDSYYLGMWTLHCLVNVDALDAILIINFRQPASYHLVMDHHSSAILHAELINQFFLSMLSFTFFSLFPFSVCPAVINSLCQVNQFSLVPFFLFPEFSDVFSVFNKSISSPAAILQICSQQFQYFFLG